MQWLEKTKLMTVSNKSTVLVTGGFDPLHSGHIAYFKDARALGDKLVVGINSDEWLMRKKGKAFMPFAERVNIIKNLKMAKGDDLADLIYYFERHVEVDSGEHGPMAIEMIQHLCGKDSKKWDEVLIFSKKALEFRINLWDGILSFLEKKQPLSPISQL